MAEGLRGRVRQARTDGKPAGTGAAAFTEAAAPPPAGEDPRQNRIALARHLENELRRLTPDFAVAVPAGYDPEQLVRDALQEIRRHHRDLIDPTCDLNTVLGAVMTAAQLGLRLGLLGQCYILPFWNSDRGVREAVFVVGYKGLAKLAHQSRMIRGLASRTVYEADEFDLSWHENRDTLIHKPQLRGDRGQPVLYYARALLPADGYQLTVPTRHADMLAFRDKHVKIKKGPWFDETGQPGCGFEWMAWKTEIIRLGKLLPLDTRFGQAVEADGGVRHELSPRANPAEVSEPTSRTIPGEYTETPPAADDPGDPWAGTDATAPPRTTTRRPPKQ